MLFMAITLLRPIHPTSMMVIIQQIFPFFSIEKDRFGNSVSGETVLHEHLWDRSPFVCPVRGRREHEEQIVASTRAVYPGSGRGGRVKPYSCLVCIELESSGA